ncbi:hypothetical protein [Saccharothrix xinjiangensis]
MRRIEFEQACLRLAEAEEKRVRRCAPPCRVREVTAEPAYRDALIALG